MENPKDQITHKIKDANNVLVTVSANPSVDQLAATIGLTLFLTKLKKHATAVFSGHVPSTLEFLKPEETIEGNTDSLQDFIISLDKAKADKIRYKVEDQMVKIFITPYRSSIDEEDLVFSKGDFNVDVVIALGVQSKEHLDQAITAHGRILHDATVATINTKEQSELGSINWTDAQASSLCEMAVVLADQLKANSFDAQMATALLTGIVAETERFSNDKTTSNTMNASAKLMAAGANQQLVATKLQETPAPPPPKPSESTDEGEELAKEGGEVGDDGSLSIHHEEDEKRPPKPKPRPEAEQPKPKESEPEKEKKPEEQPPPKKEEEPLPEPPKKEEREEKPPEPSIPPPPPPKKTEKPAPPPPEPPQIHISDQGEFRPLTPPKKAEHYVKPERREFLNEPPSSQHDEDSVVGGPAGQSIPWQPGGSHFITEPPSMGGKLSAVADDFDSDTSPLSLPPVDAPILSHDADKKKKEKRGEQKEEEKAEPAPPKAPEPVPPPEPAKPATPPPEEKKPEPPNLPQAVRESEESPGSQKAAEPPTPPPAPKPPAPPPPVTPPQVSPPPPPAPKEEEGPKSKLPPSFIDVLDDNTLKELERRTGSPHNTQTADQMRDKTLENIEEFVHSPHQKKQPLPTPEPKEAKAKEKPAEKPSEPSVPKKPKHAIEPEKEQPKKKEPLGLEYEAHESEPPARKAPEIKHHVTSPIEPGAKPKAVEEKAAKPLHEPEPSKKEAQTVEEAGKSAFGQKPPVSVPPPPKPQEEQAAKKPQPQPTAPPTPPPASADAARDAVTKAINTGGDGRTSLPPMERMGATDVDLSLHGDTGQPAAAPGAQPSGEPTRHINIDQEGNVTFRPDSTGTGQQTQNQSTAPAPTDHTASTATNPGSPPPVPPPIMPPQSVAADQNAA